MQKKSMAVYTIITGRQELPGFDFKQTPDIDLICYTDRDDLQPKHWMTRRLPHLVSDTGLMVQMLKLLPQVFFKDYRESLWVDSRHLDLIQPLLDDISDKEIIAAFADSEGRVHCIPGNGEGTGGSLQQNKSVMERIDDRQTVAIYRRHNHPELAALMRKKWAAAIKKLTFKLDLRNIPIKILSSLPVNYSLAQKASGLLKKNARQDGEKQGSEQSRGRSKKLPSNRNIMYYYPFTERPLEIRYLEITTKIGCSNMCSYCPQQLLIREYSKRSKEVLLTLDTFKNCLNKLNKSVTVKFTGLSEPFLNPHCLDMIEYAYRKGHSVVISTTLSGMKKSDLKRLEKIYFNSFLVHLPSVSGEKFPRDEGYSELLKLLIDRNISNKHYHFHGEKLHPAAEAAAELVQNKEVNSRSGNLDEVDSQEEELQGGAVSCERGFVHPVLLPNGDLVLCCMDYGLKTVIGNLLLQEPADIYKSTAFTELISASLQEQGSICHSCEDYRVDL